MNKDTEFSLALLGYADLEKQEALLGDIARMPAAQKQATMRKILAPKALIASGNQATSRDEALRRIDALPKRIVDALASKALQLVDSAWYVSKVANAVTSIEMFLKADTAVHGTGNVSFSQLDTDNYFLATALQLKSGVNATLASTSYGEIPSVVANGDFEFKANGKYMMPKDTSAELFSDLGNEKPLGYHKLANPKWLEPKVDVIFNLQWTTATAANTNLKLVMYGCTIIPY